MDPATVNTFLDRFLAVADSGFGLIAGDISYVLNALIIISITLAGAQWALAQEAPMAAFFRKVLFVGFFAFLINNWDALSTAINQSGAMLGLKAGGDGMSMTDLHNPGRVAEIGVEMFGRTAALGEGMNIITDFGRSSSSMSPLSQPCSASSCWRCRSSSHSSLSSWAHSRPSSHCRGRLQRHLMGGGASDRLGRRVRDPALSWPSSPRSPVSFVDSRRPP
jgi:hypothetical protein